MMTFDKILVVGDPHLQINRLEEAKELILKLIAISDEATCILVLGDLFHTFSVIRSEILSLWNEFFTKNKGKVIALVGNHDYATQNGGSHALEVFKNSAIIIDSFTKINEIYFAPFYRDNLAFAEMARQIPENSVLVCHQSFIGAKFSNGFEDPHGADPKCVSHLKKVVSGHIHASQMIKNIWYPGTPYQTNFGEAGEEKSVYLTDAEFKVLKSIDLDMPKFIEIKADTIQELLEKIPIPISTASYKLIAKGSPQEIKAFWGDQKVQDLKLNSKKVVDALILDKGEVNFPSIISKDKKERLNEFIKGRKWRTDAARVFDAARAFFTQ